MTWRKKWRQKRHGNSIESVKFRLMIHFSAIALTTSFLVFFAFSIGLVLQEEEQLEDHLRSFQQVAIKHYQLEQVPMSYLSKHVIAYYGESYLSDAVKRMKPFAPNQVKRDYHINEIKRDIKPNIPDFLLDSYDLHGYVAFYFEFEYQGAVIPTYLAIDSFALDFGDDNWDTLMGISMLLMVFLLLVLKASLKRVFAGLMSPISTLSEQLAEKKDQDFDVPEQAIDEIKQLTRHLNGYKQKKERLAKQELMFAKYASHELKTPISVVLGAANLQNMKSDTDFQARQRERILKAATGMQETVEVLLNIVKQENANRNDQYFDVVEKDIVMERYRQKLQPGVDLTLEIETGCQINLPMSVLNMVLKNLIENALRFTEQGEISVIIDSHSIKVTDTGSGLSDKPETEHGLGLLIVNRICQSYGWKFELQDSPKQQGSLAQMTFIGHFNS
ncbi:sensor histidine kinase [Vibrio coralliilyticus]|uniref:sensor histidine kinase n=1 Tax=Vibrio coralliilyticus TaxID=190893 RepID=UPI000C163B55|nr:HAMP domain-containing sensor histidine kinase [Vibrio coralliilyticus]